MASVDLIAADYLSKLSFRCFWRERSKKKEMGIPLDLKEFIVRARVLKLYRQALRTARRAPVDSRDELRMMIRQEMESNRKCKDQQRIRFLISEGLERLKGLSETLDMQGH